MLMPLPSTTIWPALESATMSSAADAGAELIAAPDDSAGVDAPAEVAGAEEAGAAGVVAVVVAPPPPPDSSAARAKAGKPMLRCFFIAAPRLEPAQLCGPALQDTTPCGTEWFMPRDQFLGIPGAH